MRAWTCQQSATHSSLPAARTPANSSSAAAGFSAATQARASPSSTMRSSCHRPTLSGPQQGETGCWQANSTGCWNLRAELPTLRLSPGSKTSASATGCPSRLTPPSRRSVSRTIARTRTMMTDPPPPEADTPVMLSQPQVEDVFAATEEVRATGFPSVPAELLVDVLTAEQENLDNRTAAQRAVARAVDT